MLFTLFVVDFSKIYTIVNWFSRSSWNAETLATLYYCSELHTVEIGCKKIAFVFFSFPFLVLTVVLQSKTWDVDGTSTWCRPLLYSFIKCRLKWLWFSKIQRVILSNRVVLWIISSIILLQFLINSELAWGKEQGPAAVRVIIANVVIFAVFALLVQIYWFYGLTKQYKC